jgi:hypothetical protein
MAGERVLSIRKLRSAGPVGVASPSAVNFTHTSTPITPRGFVRRVGVRSSAQAMR